MTLIFFFLSIVMQKQVREQLFTEVTFKGAMCKNWSSCQIGVTRVTAAECHKLVYAVSHQGEGFQVWGVEE